MNKTKKLYYEWGHGSVVYGKLLQSNAIKLQQFSPAVRKDLPCVSKRRASEWNLSKSVANKQTEEAVLANADLCDAVTASAVHCGVFLATHHLPLIKHWWVEQVINTTFAVHRCITHTRAHRGIFLDSWESKNPDTPVWMQQVELDPFGGLSSSAAYLKAV